MTILLPALAIAFAAFCVWLTVRIVNRRERWAKWMALAAAIGIPALYVASFGPVCWISSHALDRIDHIGARTVSELYQPILFLAWSGPSIAQRPVIWYMRLWSSDRWQIGYVSGGVQWGPRPL
jgi:hypothetical protein